MTFRFILLKKQNLQINNLVHSELNNRFYEKVEGFEKIVNFDKFGTQLDILFENFKTRFSQYDDNIKHNFK